MLKNISWLSAAMEWNAFVQEKCHISPSILVIFDLWYKILTVRTTEHEKNQTKSQGPGLVNFALGQVKMAVHWTREISLCSFSGQKIFNQKQKQNLRQQDEQNNELKAWIHLKCYLTNELNKSVRYRVEH